jgi:hypothetical protein
MQKRIFSLIMMILLYSSHSFSWPIPDTGQLTCFDNYSQIDCPEPGNDFYGQDAHYMINAPSYTKLDITGTPLHENETSWVMIRDNNTGLIWELKTLDNSIHDKYQTYEWNDAQQIFINNLNTNAYGGLTRWRLPKIMELISIIHLNEDSPVIDPVFNGIASFYWSSVPTSNTDGIWGVNFYGGIVNYSSQINLKSVRAVYKEENNDSTNWIVNTQTIIDKGTGLMWQRETMESALSWQSALAHCESLSLNNHSDWRLPNIKELLSIVDFSINNPSIISEFDSMPAFYWSSTSHTKSTKNAWGVDFDFGSTGNKEKLLLHYVRAVRGGQQQLLNHLYIQSPGQGDIWNDGNLIPIIWDANNISGDVQILISDNGGESFTPIVQKTSNDGTYDWLAPFPLIPSPNCFIKIQPIDFPDKGSSLGLFTIEGTSVTIQGRLTDDNDMPITNTSFSINGMYLQTDENGHYACKLTIFQSGAYDLLYWVNNYQANVFENVLLRIDETNVLNFKIPTIFSLNGTISNYYGEAISGITVTVLDKTVQSDLNGNFVFEKLDSGTTTIQFSHPDYYAFTETVEIIPGKCVSLNTELMQKGVVLNFVTVSLPETILGEPYQAEIKAQGTMPLTYSLISGSFPQGITINAQSGIIYGSANVAGYYTFTLGLHDASNLYAEREFTIDSFEKLTITTQQINGLTIQESYSTNIQTTGGLQPYTFELIEGSLPGGLILSSSGSISGIPLRYGKTIFTVQVTDSRAEVVNTVYEIQVYQPLSLPTEILVNGIVEQSLEMPLSATGGDGNYFWYIDSGKLPNGLTIDNTTDTLTGTFNQAVNQTIALFAKDSEGRNAHCNLTFHVVPVLTFITNDLPDALKNKPYAETILVQGGIGPYTYICKGLPQNLTYNQQTGLISGNSTLIGYNNIEVQVIDSTQPDNQILTQIIGLRTKANLSILTNNVLPKVIYGETFESITLIAGGGLMPYTWYCESLPEGVGLNALTGILTGTPLTVGLEKFTIGVQDAQNQKYEKEFVWQVIQKLEIKTDMLENAYKNIFYNKTINAFGGIPPYHFYLKSGTLPTGLFLHENGLIYGKTTEFSMPQSFTIEVMDSDTQTTKKAYHIETKKDLSLTPSIISETKVGQSYQSDIQALLGIPPYNWNTGSLPKGLTCTVNQNTVHIEGIAQEPGLFTWVVEVIDSSVPVASVTNIYTISIYDQLKIHNTWLKTARTYVYYSDTIQIEGGKPPYILRIVDNDLPEGLSFNPQTGAIYGIINDPDISAVAFNAEVQDSCISPTTLSQTVKFEVSNELDIVTEIIPNAMQFQYFSTTLVGGGGSLPYQWHISEGVLPHCVLFNESTGELYGNPNNAGSFSLKFELTDNWDRSDRVYNWTVVPVQVVGDMNNDLKIDLLDLVLSLQYISNITNENTGSFDINYNCRFELTEVLYLIDRICY